MRLTRQDLALKARRTLGELLLIVSAVLIALAADSWWQARQERQQEKVYLTQLLADTRETESRLKTSIAGDTAMLERVLRVLDQAFNGPLPASDGPLAIVEDEPQHRYAVALTE